MSTEFGNLKDDNTRLNEHARVAVYELKTLINRWHKYNMDARAIYSALAIFHDYYFRLGHDRLGEAYMMKLDLEAHKLAEEMIKQNELRGT